MEELEALAEEEQDDSSTASSEYLVQSRSYAFIAASSIIAAAYTNRSLTGAVTREKSLGLAVWLPSTCAFSCLRYPRSLQSNCCTLQESLLFAHLEIPNLQMTQSLTNHGAGVVYLLAFFAWGALNLGNRLFGRLALWLWSSVVAYSALLTCARSGMHLAFTLGRTEWSADSRTGQILSLLGFTAAGSGWQYVLVYSCLQAVQLCHSSCPFSSMSVFNGNGIIDSMHEPYRDPWIFTIIQIETLPQNLQSTSGRTKWCLFATLIISMYGCDATAVFFNSQSHPIQALHVGPALSPGQSGSGLCRSPYKQEAFCN